ncbi:hypothetical protein [Virgibacillus sp. DJP39]
MDELLYVIAFVIAVIGAFGFLRYGKSKKVEFARILRKQNKRKIKK